MSIRPDRDDRGPGKRGRYWWYRPRFPGARGRELDEPPSGAGRNGAIPSPPERVDTTGIDPLRRL